jgi:hypothetical protein
VHTTSELSPVLSIYLSIYLYGPNLLALCCGDVPLLGEPALVHGVVARVLHEPLLLPDHVVDLLVAQLPDHRVLNVFAFRFDFLRKFAD